MFCTEFIFDRISSKDLELQICSFEGSQSGNVSIGSHIEFTTFKAPNSNKWVKTGSNYTEQLTFNFQVCRCVCCECECNQTISEPIPEDELAYLMRWLVQKDYKDLQFVQEGCENIFYHCQINAQKYEIGGRCYGLTLTVVCDASFGWSDWKSVSISSSGNLSTQLFDSSDEIGQIYPNMEILSKSERQDIRIYNEMTDTETLIKNCVKNEHISIQEMKISSSECYKSGSDFEGRHKTLYDDFNWKWFSIGNIFEDRVNKITITGNCDIQLNWRVPRKAVI